MVDHEEVRRRTRERDAQPSIRCRHVATTDGTHAGPIRPDLASDVVPRDIVLRDVVPDGPNRIWLANLAYGAVAGGFVGVAIVLDAGSRRWRSRSAQPRRGAGGCGRIGQMPVSASMLPSRRLSDGACDPGSDATPARTRRGLVRPLATPKA